MKRMSFGCDLLKSINAQLKDKARLLSGKTQLGKYVSFVRKHRPSQIWNCVLKKTSPPNGRFLTYRPLHLVFRITSRCNMNCNFCLRKAPSVPAHFFEFQDMTLENFISLTGRYSEAYAVELSGGEPLLHKDFFEMAKYAYSRQMEVCASTNGIILHDKLNQIIKSPLSLFNVSLDAVNPVDYEKMHGFSGDVFYSILQSITELVAIRNRSNPRLELRVSYICTKSNYRRIPDMVRLAQDLGVDQLDLTNLFSYDLPGFSSDQSLYDDDSDVLEVLKDVERARSNLRVKMPELLSHQITRRLCKMPFRTLTMDADGSYYVCCQMTKNEGFGGIMGDEDVWNGSAFQRIRRILTDVSVPLPEVCRFCRYLFRPYKMIG